MNKQIVTTILTLIILGVSNMSFAQKTGKGTSISNYLKGDVYTVGYSDSTTHFFIDYFKKSMPKGFREASHPRFLIVGNNHEFLMGIGGNVNVTMGYGFKNNIPNSGFVTYLTPTSTDPRNSQSLMSSVNTSRLLFRFLTLNEKFKGFEALIETDFNGVNNNLRIRKAYIKYKGLILGQTNSFFIDGLSTPTTVDSQGPNGFAYLRAITIGYSNTFWNRLTMGIAVEAPGMTGTYSVVNNSGDSDVIAQMASQRIPDVPIFASYSFPDKLGYIKAAGVLRGLTYYSNEQNSIQTKFGWGAQLSGKINAHRNLSFYFGCVYGEGIGEYIQDFQGFGLDLVPLNNRTMGTLPMLGWHTSFTYNVNPDITLTCIYSQAKLFEKNITFDSNMYKVGRYFAGNVLWSPIKSLQLGLEYNWGQRVNQNGVFGNSNRIIGMIVYNF